MGLFDIISSFSNNGSPLKKPGDKISAEITHSGRQVMKLHTENNTIKHSLTRYPSTGTEVETFVRKKSK